MSRIIARAAVATALALAVGTSATVAVAAPAPQSRSAATSPSTNYACQLLVKSKAPAYVPNAKWDKGTYASGNKMPLCTYTTGGSDKTYNYGAAVAIFGPTASKTLPGNVDAKVKNVLATYPIHPKARPDLGAHTWFGTWNSKGYHPEVVSWWQNNSIVMILFIVPTKSQGAITAIAKSVRANFKAGHLE